MSTPHDTVAGMGRYQPLLESSDGAPSPTNHHLSLDAERGTERGATTMNDRVRSWASLRGDASPTWGRPITGRPPSGSGYSYGPGGGQAGSVFGSYGDDGGGDRGGGLGLDAPGRASKPTLGVRDTRGR
jgi:hypothetical protein